jgi:cytoskeletal protein RodZ
VPGPTTGIGPALREARETLGKTIEEASRDTRIRTADLAALERESFDALKGDVYVRGFLRSYSAYLGLDPDKVVVAYADAVDAAPEDADELQEAPPPVEPKPIRTLHRRANWKLAFLVAVVLLVAFAAAGLLARNQPAPDAVPTSPGASASAEPLAASDLAYVYLKSTKPVEVNVIADGQQMFSEVLRPNHPQQFTAANVVRVRIASGAVVEITVNGHELGAPGTKHRLYEATFTPQDYRELSSPAA